MDPVTAMMWTTPGSWRTDDGIYEAEGHVWLYWRLDLSPLHFEDDSRRYEVAEPLERILGEIGDTARTSPFGDVAQFAQSRPIHILALVWEDVADVPASSSSAHAAYMREALGSMQVPHKGLYLGVELWPEVTDAGAVMTNLRNVAIGWLGDHVPDLAPYQKDKALMDSIFGRWGASRLTSADNQRIESWYNDAKGPDVTVVADQHRLLIDRHDVLEFAALVDFERFRLNDPGDLWLAAAFGHREKAIAVSIRAEMQRPEVVRSRARSVQRKVRSQIEEQLKTTDLERSEDHDLAGLAKQVEDHFATGGAAILSKCSIILARRATTADQTYIDLLRNAYGIRIRPLAHRQFQALSETLPGSTARAARFEHDLLIPMVAHAGLSAWSDLGDDKGVLLGMVLPDLVPTLLDTEAASRLSRPPGFVVVGEPGGGKTFVLQSIAYQSVLDGKRVIMINPKTDDDLSPTIDLLRSDGFAAELVSMSDLQAGSGAFDPWRYAKTPEAAAEMAAQHITNVLTLDQERYVALKSGLVRGAHAGAGCVMEALEAGVNDATMIDLITDMAAGTPLFRLGIGNEAVSRPASASPGLTLIQFDQPLDLPDPATPRSEYLPSERAAIAALRLIFRASTETLLRPRGSTGDAGGSGGVLIVDEAWTFMASREGLAALQKIGREGRSQQVLPILATQRLADVTTAELVSYLSRVLVLGMKDPDEAVAALTMCGLEPTPQRLAWLAQAGVVEPTATNPGRPPVGLMSDIHGRHAGIVLGPTPERHRAAYSTSSTDRDRRRHPQDVNW
ncbi:MAG: ATP-binding protein [Actinomycetota bacterium]|nr:ATP-binding protein [Actinomycetota bacterium]